MTVSFFKTALAAAQTAGVYAACSADAKYAYFAALNIVFTEAKEIDLNHKKLISSKIVAKFKYPLFRRPNSENIGFASALSGFMPGRHCRILPR
ncbi:MAG: hypothetical protein IAB19_01995 [Proteobacteria bacterium]|uniref:Uncharacterized protein n=1 Tax=Candidatus Avisuccinivibrio stercorigallinarum TaxID=2840704 RepID=A0A9D9DB04_9GAMM|nr:hypothetical protein [Candidatus Avisuccinivibrio stercorigallinarum]